MQQDDRLYLLIARKLSGEATENELRDLREWLEAHIDNAYLYELLSAYWEQHPSALPANDKSAQEMFKRILCSSPPPAKSDGNQGVEQEVYRLNKTLHKSWKQWVYAAAAVLIIGGLAWIYTFFPEQHVKTGAAVMSEVVAEKGSRKSMILPDGTKVWLNADSRLAYTGSFEGVSREVQLEGEAFFDVVKDSSRPFIVHTSGIDIKVLGTSFNVKAYADDATIETTLIRGMIEVLAKNDPSSPGIILHPNEKLVFSKAIQKTLPQPATAAGRDNKKAYTAERGIAVAILPPNKADSMIAETSWIYNKLIFEGDTFRQLADKMERWYDVKIHIRDERLLHYRFKGIFEHETIQQALLALQLTNNFQFKINGNEIEIYRN
ncbi:MAG TPA: DUF4974 domain-containing protein [Agriterribacter sp.]|nr:DUF4974 domain-containing protein [Agriterribacter sp.]